MKKCFLLVSALLTLGSATAAADELVFAPAAHIDSAPPYLSWSGFYVGLSGGYAFGNSTVIYSPNDPAAALGTCGGGPSGAGIPKGTCIPSADFRRDGPLVGGQAGFNWQVTSRWLVGGELDYQWADFTGSAISTFRLGAVGTTNAMAKQTVESFGTARVRMGVIFTNPLLLYGTAGLAFGQLSETVNMYAGGTGAVTSGGFSYSCIVGASCFAASSSKMVFGWTAGVGAEYALTTYLTAKTELLYVSLGSPQPNAFAQGVVGGTAPASFAANFSQATFFVLRGGVSYRF